MEERRHGSDLCGGLGRNGARGDEGTRRGRKWRRSATATARGGGGGGGGGGARRRRRDGGGGGGDAGLGGDLFLKKI